jgi:hypothetical protein
MQKKKNLARSVIYIQHTLTKKNRQCREEIKKPLEHCEKLRTCSNLYPAQKRKSPIIKGSKSWQYY